MGTSSPIPSTGALPLDPTGGLPSPRPPAKYATGPRVGPIDNFSLATGLEKGACLGSHDPINYFRELNANSFKIAKDMNFKFGTQDHRESPDTTSEKIEMVRGQGEGHVTPYILGR